jgi:hypothetical protein
MSKLQQLIKQHPAPIWFICGVVFAHFGFHIDTYILMSNGVDWAMASLNPEPTFWEKITFRG